MPPDETTSTTAERVGDESLRRPLGLLAGGGGMVSPTGVAAPLPVHGWRRVVSALHYRNYRLLWAGALVSNIGSWMQAIACEWLVYQLSGRALWLGINAFAEGAAVVALLPLGGVLADRLDRRRILITTNFISGLLAAGLSVLAATGSLRAWHIVAVSLCNGVMNAVRFPAVQSLLPSLVHRSDLGNAVALNSMQFNLSRSIGPVLGGLTLWKLGAAWSFGLNALSFLAVIGALLAVRDVPELQKRRESVWTSLRSGFRYVGRRSDVLVMLVLVVLGGVLGAPVMKMLPAMVHDVYGLGAGYYSVLLSCFGVGAIFGALLLAARSSRGPTPWRAIPLLAGLGALQVVMGFGPPFAALMFLVGLCGAMFIGSMVRLNTAVLHSTPDLMRGRVSSLHMMSLCAGIPLGGLIWAAVTQRASVGVAFWSAGALLIAAMPVVMLAMRRGEVSYQHTAGGVPEPGGAAGTAEPNPGDPEAQP